MKLYHISFTRIPNAYFYPRVPGTVAFYEDDCSERICFSESIVGCLAAIGDCETKLEECEGKAWLYSIDTDDFDRQVLFSWDELYKDNSVEDSPLTHEWWLMIDCIAKEQEIYFGGFTGDLVNWVPNYYKKEVLDYLCENQILREFIKSHEYLINDSDAYELLNDCSDFMYTLWKWEAKHEVDMDLAEELQYIYEELCKQKIITRTHTVTDIEFSLDKINWYQQTLQPGAYEWYKEKFLGVIEKMQLF